MPRRVLVVDNEALVRWSLVERLRQSGCETLEAGTAAQAIELADAAPDLVLIDYQLPDSDGASLAKALVERDPDVLVIMLTDPKKGGAASGVIGGAVFDHAAKPIDLDDVVRRVERALEMTRLHRELRTLRDIVAGSSRLESIVGESEPMQRVKALVRKIATSQGSTVLITGERGTGKGLIARVIHGAGHRAARPFVDVSCPALPDAVLESTIFGHGPGAVPGAGAEKRGVLEQADEGTVFFEEIGDLTPALQADLVRFLEEKTFHRMGGTADIHVDVRVCAATSRNLEELVRLGRFRDDLYYRLNVLRVEVPPLRARGEDIVLLARHFAEQAARDHKRGIPGLSPAVEEALRAYPWPGNVGELRNLVDRAVMLAHGDVLEPADFDALRPSQASPGEGHGPFNLPADGVHLDEVERGLVIQALERAGGNQTRAASLLGLHRDQIRYRIEKFGLNKKG